MIILLPLLHKLTIGQRTILGRTLVLLGTIGVAAGLTGQAWLLGLSAVGLLVGVVALASARRSRRREPFGRAV